MARNACYAAKQALFERDMAQQRFMPISPVALTGSQERAERGGSKGWKADAKMWKLRAQNPQLFANIDKIRTWESLQQTAGAGAGVVGAGGPPAGFERVQKANGEPQPGWLMHKEEAYYLETQTDRLLWLDTTNRVYRELSLGDDFLAGGRLSISATAAIASPGTAAGAANGRPGGAAAGASTAGGSSSSGGPSRTPSAAAARHLVITDLHKVADVYNLQLGHLDRPAMMLAAYGSIPGGTPPDIAVKGLHERLLRRLAGFRGHWPDDALQAALAEALAAIGSEYTNSLPSGAPATLGTAGVAGAVAVIFGTRLVIATTHGSSCCIVDYPQSNEASSAADLRIVSQSSRGSTAVATSATSLNVRDTGSTVILLLNTEILEEPAMAAARFAVSGRCRAGTTALLQGTLREQVPTNTLAAACARIAWLGGGSSSSGGAGERPQKRARTGEPSMEGEQVRYRQILLKYVGCKQATDPVRRRPVRRTQGEAEAAMLEVLQALQSEAARGAAAASRLFTERCRAVSECQSSLRGGEFAGDVGWQRYPAAPKPGEKVPKDVASRHAVIKAAFDLDVGELSDILVSDDGVHLLKRSA